MELQDLDYGLKSIASAGHTLSVQELLGLRAGLATLQCNERLERIYFWGKIFGESSDYYIAFSLRDAEPEFPAKSFYFSGENFSFEPMKQLTEETADLVMELAMEKVFSGKSDAPLAPEFADQNQQFAALTEHDRLAQVVLEIDFDSAAAPRGAFALNEAHMVVPNSDFRGLGLKEASSLNSYVHFRPPTSVQALRVLTASDSAFFGDFLDPLANDLPKGCWSIREDSSVMCVTLRSLVWPGYVAYNIPGTNRFGGLYFGYGKKCRDLPFIL